MSLSIQLQHRVTTCAHAGPNAMRIAAMFGLSLDASAQQVIIPPTQLTLVPGQVVFVTGVSGGGKSTLVRLIEHALTQGQGDDAASSPPSPSVVRVDRLPPLPDTSLVQALARPECDDDDDMPAAPLETICGWLSRAGLNDAAVMLRRPGELSEGQRHRLRLAQAMAVAERRGAAWSVLLADEFGSTLDRTTAHVMSRSIRRWVARSGVCLVTATAHDDLLEPLDPDVLIEVSPGGRCSVHARAC